APEVRYTLRWDGPALHVDLGEPLRPGTEYLLTVNKTAANVDGIAFRESDRWSIVTPEVLAYANPPTTPHPDGQIELRFSYPMDAPSVEHSVHLAPALA